MPNLFAAVKSGAFKSALNKTIGFGASASNPLIQALSEATSLLRDRVKVAGDFSSIFSAGYDFFSDDVIDDQLDRGTNVTVSSAIGLAIFNDFKEWININGQSSTYGREMVLTSSDGHTFILFVNSEGNIHSRTLNADSGPLMIKYGNEVTMWLVIPDVNDDDFSFWDLVKDQVVNAEVNDCLLFTSEIMLSGQVSAARNLVSSIQTYASNARTAVKDVCSNIVRTFSLGGFYGVIRYILSFIQATASLQVGEDGLLEFSNNSSLVPQLYIAGFVSAVVNSMTAVVSSILSVIQPVLGFIGVLAGGIVNSFVGMANYDFTTNTNASINTEATSNLLPMALSQSKGVENLMTASSDYKALFELGCPFRYQVPGGELILSYAPTNDSHDTFNVIQEFHPDLIDRRSILRTIIQNKVSYTPQTGSSAAQYHWTYGLNRSEVLNVCSGAQSMTCLSNNNNGVLSDDDDAEARLITAANIILFLLYAGSNNLAQYDLVATNALSSLGGYLVDSGWSDANFPYALGYMLLYFYQEAFGVQHFASNVTWARITKACDAIDSDSVTVGNWVYTSIPADALQLCKNRDFLGSVTQLYGSYDYALRVPKYDKASFWFNVIAATAAATVVSAIAVVTSIAAVKAIKATRTKNARAIETAWSNYLKDPSDTNAKAYSKAVRKNNAFANIFGGTKYSKEGMWGSVDDGSESLVSEIGSDSIVSASSEVETTNAAITKVAKLINGL